MSSRLLRLAVITPKVWQQAGRDTKRGGEGREVGKLHAYAA